MLPYAQPVFLEGSCCSAKLSGKWSVLRRYRLLNSSRAEAWMAEPSPHSLMENFICSWNQISLANTQTPPAHRVWSRAAPKPFDHSIVCRGLKGLLIRALQERQEHAVFIPVPWMCPCNKPETRSPSSSSPLLAAEPSRALSPFSMPHNLSLA